MITEPLSTHDGLSLTIAHPIPTDDPFFIEACRTVIFGLDAYNMDDEKEVKKEHKMRKIYSVDAFTSVPYKGNPAAVMIVDEFPEDMQQIAFEMNLSETAFVKPLGRDHFHIRWMTPATEVKLCGHATLAASHIIFENGLNHSDKLRFDCLSRELSVRRSENGYVLDFPLQETGTTLDKTPFTKALKTGAIQEVLQAFDDVIVRVSSEEEVRSLQPDIALLSQLDARGIIVTAPGESHDFVSRFFAPKVGVNEDPVTGSAHCKLAYYWMNKLNKTTFKAYQASLRGGELLLEVVGDRVLITGQAVTFLEGVIK